MDPEQQVLIKITDLKKYYPIKSGILIDRAVGFVHAVDGISFDILRGETLGLVGESGCGKSTTGKTILRLEQPTAGQIFFDGEDISTYSRTQMRPLRKQMQIIFQDPYSSLNPRMTVSEIVGDPLAIHTHMKKNKIFERVQQLLELVGLNPHYANRYPHEFSGGQRQRIGIARALALNPSFIVCDEPISALDVSVQAQVVNLLEDLQEQFHLTYLFIAHDLSMVRYISTRVAVMYLGHFMEITDRDELYNHPLHPYTQALISAVPIPDCEAEAKRQRIILKGEMPSPSKPPTGCVFHPRCFMATEECKRVAPPMREVKPRHFAACLMI